VGDQLQVETGIAGVAVQWFANGAALPGETGTEFTPTREATYYAVVGNGDCEVTSEEITLYEIPETPVVTVPPPTCEGAPLGDLTAQSNGGVVWFRDQALTQEVARGEAFNPGSLAGTTTYWVAAFNGDCASEAVAAVVEIIPNPVATLQPAGTVCAGTRLEVLSDQDGLSYQWFRDGTQLINNGATLVADQPGSYAVLVSNDHCRVILPAVRVQALPEVDAGEPRKVCLGDEAGLAGNAEGLSFQWEPAALLENPQSLKTAANLTETTTFYLPATDSLGCVATDSVTITVVDAEVTAGFSPNVAVGYAPLEVTFTNRSTGYDSLAWTVDGDTVSTAENPVYTFEETGEYVVGLTASREGVCFADTSFKFIRVVEPLEVPNAISPNGDGVNDRWIIDRIELFPENSVRVYNQWGSLVYESQYYQNDFDGGQLADATYFYVIQLGSNAPDLRGYLLIMR
jgi:gliding motility-associated-like protein